MEKFRFDGVSQFFYAAIPAVLALAAIWWLAFGQGLHYFRRALSQEKRHAEIVGAAILPKTPLKIRISDTRDAAVQIDRAEIDGGDLWIYYKNTGDFKKGSIRFTWKQISPDGTVVSSLSGFADVYGENRAADSLDPGERGELHLKIEPDPRAVILDIRMQ